MGEVYSYILALVVGVVIGIGIAARAMRSPPTYSDQWESVYVTCTRGDGGVAGYRSECIAAADRVMKCAGEVKP